MCQDPLVSIGMPMYNAEKFIRQAVYSVLNQTYTNFEFIITDDGSSDQSINIVNSFNDFRIILLSDGENKGISFRLNEQIAIAKGKYFVRMDSDDIMFPNRIEAQIKYLEENEEIDVVGSSVVVIDDDNQIISLRETPLLTHYENLFTRILFNHPTVTGKLTFFKKYKYSNDLIGVEDADLWIRSFAECKFFTFKYPLLFYRDPLVFKLKTYKFRLKQKNKLYRTNKYLQKNIFLKIKLITINYAKIFVATFFSLLKLDHYLLARRNNTETIIDHQWEEILKKMRNGK